MTPMLLNMMLTMNIGMLFGSFLGCVLSGRVSPTSAFLGIVSGAIAMIIQITRPLWRDK